MYFISASKCSSRISKLNTHTQKKEKKSNVFATSRFYGMSDFIVVVAVTAFIVDIYYEKFD